VIENVDDSDSDVEEMPNEIETVDLCTQSPVINERARRIVPSRARRNNQTVGASENVETIDLCTQAPIVDLTMLEAPPSRNNLQNTAGPQTSSHNNNRTTPYAKPSKEPRGTRCPICFSSAKNHEPVATPCGHIYCKNCITTTLKSRVEKKCPMCKEELPKEKPFFRVFL
jgi:hypothetical protein